MLRTIDRSAARLARGTMVVSLILLVGCSESSSWSGWSPGTELDVNPDARLTRLAQSPNGEHTLATWWQVDIPDPDGSGGLSVSWYRGGNAWSPREIIDGRLSQQIPVQAAVDDDGNAIVVWMQGNLETRLLDAWGSWYDPSEGWSEPAPLIVEPARAGFRDTPLVVLEDDGSALLTWVLERPSPEESPVTLTRCRRDHGCEEVDSYGTTFQSANLLAMEVDPSGVVTVVLSGLSTAINRYDPNNGWGEPDVFADDALPGIPLVRLTQGVAWAFWPGDEAEAGRVTGVTRSTSQGWEAPTFLDWNCPDACPGPESLSNFAIPQGFGAIAVDDEGGAVVLWTLFVRGSDVRARGALWSRYVPGTGWTTTRSFPLGGESAYPFASLATLDDGRTVALWYEGAGDGFFGGVRLPVWANVLDPQLGWGGPTRLANEGTFLTRSGPRSVPSLAQSGNRGIGLWLQRSSDPSFPDDFGSSPWASEFR